MADPRRIAILGGGIAALTTALELTSAPDWQSRYDVTVYQMGWRLGGKGASSRNPAASGRIEEHGLHVWFGCYDNAFRLLRGCYDELRRPASSPFSTLEEAFTPQNETPYFERVDGHWTVWPLWFPPGPDKPGTGGPMPSVWDYLVMTVEAIVHAAEALLHLTGRPPDVAPEPPHPSIRAWLAAHVPHPVTAASDALLAGVLHVVHTIPRDPAAHHPLHLASLLWLLEEAKTWLLGHLADLASGSTEMRRAVIELDLGLTLVIGCLRDDVPSAGFDAIDEKDAREWFAGHGAAPTSVDSTPVRALYDLYLAYEGGDQSRPRLAAGVAIHAVLRLALGYKGAVVYEMRAGMGEVVIAPIYEALEARGVKFAFFHRVERLELAADRSRVARIHLARQVELKDGTTTGYRPLHPVDGLPCWPSEPFADQIKDGDALRGVDLESRWSGWQDVDHPVLEAGRDFDVAVLGISLGGLRDIAADFRGDGHWRDMLDRIGTTQSASAQLWMDASLADLGWRLGPVPADAAPEPLDVWADRSELLHLEDWPEPGPRSVQYLCGAIPGDDYLRPPTDTGVPAAALANVTSITATWLDDAGTAMWPGARSAAGGFDWNTLHDPTGGTGHARLVAQYLRANIDPSERYVLSLPGTVRYRLAADGSGYENLVLTGDWTKTDWNVGCIEAAVSSGINAAAAIAGRGSADPDTTATSPDRSAPRPATPTTRPRGRFTPR
jgi:uncharacterized protein with NAD-binding domain and iron-sulfur cluster